MGLAIARTFGRHGFAVALLARHQGHLDGLVAQLAHEGVIAEGFVADVADRPSLVAALAAVRQHFGPVDVLEFSPADRAQAIVGATEVTSETVQPQIDFYLYGAITAVQHVLPEMLARGSGTLLFTTGASSVSGNAAFGNVGIAMAGLRNWASSLHSALAPRGIQVGHVAIGAWIGQQPGADPENIAPLYWDLHTNREQVEHIFPAG